MLHSRRNHATKGLLQDAADAVEPTGEGRGRRKPVLKAVLAAGAGWALVNVARKARRKAEQPGSTSTTDADSDTASEAAEAAATAKAAAPEAEVRASADGVPAQRHTGAAEPAKSSATRSSATKANASSK
jgi:hypothetical protein